MLFHERKQEREMARAEAEGQSFWTPTFSEETRNKIIYAARDAAGEAWTGVRNTARNRLLASLGRASLSGGPDTQSDLGYFFVACPHDVVPGVIEALDQALQQRYRYQTDLYGDGVQPDLWSYRTRINEILQQHRICYEFRDGRIETFESKELYSNIVAPTLTLLASKTGWEKVELAFQKALKEVTSGDPDDAITDAAAALQEAFWAAGCDGNDLGHLVRDAKKKGLLAPHDQTLSDGIAKIVHWVSADRSEMGDAHKAQTNVTRSDAWFTVHVVAALIVRLSEGVRG